MPHSTVDLFTRRRLLSGAAELATTSLAANLSASRAWAQVPPVTPRPAPAFVNQTISVTDAGSTLQRSFLVHLPLSAFPMPAVIVFHGGGQDASAMVQHWESLIPAYDIVIVCPQALVDPTVNETHWYAARPGDAVVPTTDLAFVNALLNWLAATGRVDMQRVYAAGFSNARR